VGIAAYASRATTGEVQTPICCRGGVMLRIRVKMPRRLSFPDGRTALAHGASKTTWSDCTRHWSCCLRRDDAPARLLVDLTSQDGEVDSDSVSVYDAKARFSKLVERAEAGRSTAITKRGRVVARIVPAGTPRWDRSAVLDEAETFRRSVRIKGRVDIRGLIEQGRR